VEPDGTDERFMEESAESLRSGLISASLTPHDRNEVGQQPDSARRCLDFREKPNIVVAVLRLVVVAVGAREYSLESEECKRIKGTG
jgi:hypothetical protein